MMAQTRRQGQSGFSLMEVLVALAVLAIAMAGLIKIAGGSTANLAYLENKTIAHWVGMNQIAAARVADPKPQVGMSQGEETMAGRDWGWSLDVAETPDLDVLRLEVAVRRSDGDDETVYATLTGYAAR